MASNETFSKTQSIISLTAVSQGEISRPASEGTLENEIAAKKLLSTKGQSANYLSTGVLTSAGRGTKRKIASRRKPAKYVTQSETDLRRFSNTDEDEDDFVDISKLPPLPQKIAKPQIFPKQKINKSQSVRKRIDAEFKEKWTKKLDDFEDYEDVPEARLVPEEDLAEDYDEPIPHAKLFLQ